MTIQNKLFLLQDKYKHDVWDILNWSESSVNLYDFYLNVTFFRGILNQFGFKFTKQYQNILAQRFTCQKGYIYSILQYYALHYFINH